MKKRLIKITAFTGIVLFVFSIVFASCANNLDSSDDDVIYVDQSGMSSSRAIGDYLKPAAPTGTYDGSIINNYASHIKNSKEYKLIVQGYSGVLTYFMSKCKSE